MLTRVNFFVRSAERDAQRCRLSRSVCMRAQNDWATALSYGSPTLPSEGRNTFLAP
jgi:hypothetical protein